MQGRRETGRAPGAGMQKAPSGEDILDHALPSRIKSSYALENDAFSLEDSIESNVHEYFERGETS